MFVVNKNPTPKELRKFGWAMIGGFVAIGLLLWLAPWIKSRDGAALAWTGSGVQLASLSAVLLGVCLLAASRGPHSVARRVYVAWMSLVVPIGIAMSALLLTALFVLLLPVFAMIVRLGDPLRRKLKSTGSYWEDYRPYEPTVERMKRPF